MNPTTALKPLAFALAAVMAFAAQADPVQGNGQGSNQQSNGPSLDQILQITSGAGAAVLDSQESSDSGTVNRGTQNDAKIDNSLNSSNGNMGANVAAGNGNQQDNAAALATADEAFIFGSAVTVSSATQKSTGNTARNHSNTNTTTLNNAGNSGSGNIGINVTTGDFNQQKNNLAIAVSGGRVAVAAAAANQSTSGLKVSNNARTDFVPVGVLGLSGITTQQVVTPEGWRPPVTNNASITGSMNNFSGNGGANVSSGVGNQQSNSLSIAAGCKSCP
ncbi:heme utilization protein [Pseudomonas laurylsulfatiphila]|uniref:heme utilization protein n=1 Tax=Pseudomonas laurylsulfatiphila TaxID=2011015 RepID=UPI003D22A7F8|nr:heat shock protein HslJ [Pseudomonas reinekei]MDF9907393.1 heat shock protein HslJ [Pseudomonas reinekei]